jgi:hypothetical protein
MSIYFIFLVFIIFVPFLLIYGPRYIYDYAIKDGSIHFIIFRLFSVYSLSLKDINAILIVSWLETGIGGTTLRLGNRFQKKCILIKKSTGLFHSIIITPSEPELFIKQAQDIKNGDSIQLKSDPKD